MEPDREKIEKLTKEEEIVYLVAGTINATGRMLYWNDTVGLEIGDYAIVENMNGYDLIEVIGKIKTTKEKSSKFSNTIFENIKKVVRGLKKENIEKLEF